MRDEVTCGAVEKFVSDIEKTSVGLEEVIYTNGWLAKYAQDVAKRLN